MADAELNYHSSWPRGYAGILDGTIIGSSQRTEGEDCAVIEGDQERGKGSTSHCWVSMVEMHVTDWAAAQKEDPELDAVLQWLEAKKKTDLRTLLGEHISSEEGWIIWRNCQNFMVLQSTLYLHSMPKGENEDLLLFMVPKTHQTASLNGCH